MGDVRAVASSAATDRVRRALDPARSGSRPAPLTESARAAVTALARALALLDPAVARQGALRAGVVDHVASRLGFEPGVHAEATAAALLADLSQLVLRRPVPPHEHAVDVADAVLAARLLDDIPDLAAVSRSVRQLAERWDGAGGPQGMQGDDLSLAGRLAAVSTALVGRPDLGAIPSWTANMAHVRAAAGVSLDPELVERVVEILRSDPVDAQIVDLDRVLTVFDALVDLPASSSPVDALVTMGAAIEAADHVEDVLSLIADRAREALRTSTVTIGRVDLADRTIQVVVNAGELGAESEHFPAEEVYPLDGRPRFAGLLDSVASARSIAELPDDQAHDLVERGIQSEIMVPITIHDDLWGAVWASSRPGQRLLDENDVTTLRLVASHVATGVAQAERFAELETLALRDPLTGLGNRRVLDERLGEIFRRPAIERQDAAVIMCDVDGLKRVNDTHGHEAGDAILIEAADALRAAVADVANATVCRIGGDEFCIVLDGGGLLSAHPVAALAQRVFASGNGEGTRSLSCGVAVATIDMQTPGELLRAADEQQYQEKRERKAERGEILPERRPTRGTRRRSRRDY